MAYRVEVVSCKKVIEVTLLVGDLGDILHLIIPFWYVSWLFPAKR